MKTPTLDKFPKKVLRQIVVSCGEGALAAHAAQDYVERLRGTQYE